jgi:predicted flap endonuclease-1-like 5' DNA nuclease
MNNISEFIQQIPEFAGIFVLMLSTFLIGYFAASWLQKNKFRKVIERLKQEVNALKLKDKKERDFDSLFSEMKPRIMEVVKQAQEELDEEEEAYESTIPKPEIIAEKARTTYVSYNVDKPELNFDSFGYADHDNKDDLTKIMGIGPYIEQKLNEIGICNYDQISKLKEADIRIITELIDFFPGRIERDNWVGQAKALKVH